MDEEIVIQSYTESRNASGEQVLSWATYATLLARVEWQDVGLKETHSANQQTAFRRIAFWIRYDSEIDEKMRITYRSQILDIQGIRVEGRDRYTVITCQMREQAA